MNEVIVKSNGKKFLFWEYISDFVIGLYNEPINVNEEKVCNAAYVASRILGLKMPDDFSPEGTAGVISMTILAELYVSNNMNLKNGHKRSNYDEAYRVGRSLSSYSDEQLAATALYLIYRGRHLDSNHRELAKEVLRGIKTSGTNS